ncbi:MAG: trypsin-like peptidase domain-containing protein [Phototrophicales bacterium]|nr:trypsin-like peptidase domain-containing protein [Phototrophicales bacterium]
MMKLIGMVALCLFIIVPTLAQTTIPDLDLDRIRRSTVYIMQIRTVGGIPIITCVGSGTIIDRSGLIITNAHNTVTNNACSGDTIIISLSILAEEPPVPSYYADIAQSDIGQDLALLRITRELSGRVVNRDALSLPFVELGNSTNVNLDETITVAGYPDVGNSSVETLRGTVSSFVSEPIGGDRSWIKTDTPIPGTMTGGGVYNQQGQLIGIPTTVPVRPLSADETCLLLADTNGDGLVNNRDSCVPIGGFINTIRPVNFVRPLQRGAALGIMLQRITQPVIQLEGGGDPTVSRLFIAPSEIDGMPTTVSSSLPTGTDSLYLFFDYRNMTPDTIYELRVTIDDRPSPTFSLAPVRWGGGQNGMWYIGSRGQVYPNGIYRFTLYINGLASGSREIIIGTPQQNTASFSNIAFGIEDGENLYGRNNILPTGIIVNARFIYRNISDGAQWAEIWYYGDTIIRRNDSVWANDTRDTRIIRVEAPGGSPLPSGRYRLELYLEGLLVATSDFVIAGAREGAFPRVFSNVRFTSADSLQVAVTNPSVRTFSTTTRQIYGLFDWEFIAPGTLWRVVWSVDNVAFYDQTLPWDNIETGQNFGMLLSSASRIPDGTYRLQLFMGPALLATFEAQVGIGQLPIDPFAQSTGVQMNGRVIDAETRVGIPNVSFIVISEDFSVEDFVWTANQVYTQATTDRNGRFQLERPLLFGLPYSVIVVADGYLTVSADAVEVDAETENPLEVVIVMTKD